MYDTTIHQKTLARQIRLSDFEPGPLQISVQDKEKTIEDALRIAESGFQSVGLRRASLAGKAVFQQTSLAETLLIRHATSNVQRVTGVKQADRESIIRCLKALTSEGLAFKILRLDIKSFYESVRPLSIIEDLHKDAAFSRQSIKVLNTFFQTLAGRGISGLPRGLGISATLSEYLLRSFDMEISKLKGVRFYSRYVDDIIVVTSPRVDLDELKSTCSDWLPLGLDFSRNKSKKLEFTLTKASSPTPEKELEFLGYAIGISSTYRKDGSVRRDVDVDISKSKVKKIKNRVARSILAFNEGGSFCDLHHRIRLLTSNFVFEDGEDGSLKYAGLRYNYSLIDAKKSSALTDLDKFLHNALFSTHAGNRLRPVLNHQQARALWGYGFRRGFIKNVFFSFNNNDLHRITGCWAHA